MNITFKIFSHDSPFYGESLIFRNRVLIEAVGRNENCRDFDFPEKDLYLSAFDGDLLIGTAILTPLDDASVRMRQMAVHEDFRNRGVGRLIVDEFERIAIGRGCPEIILHARESALGFYEKCGYRRTSEKFHEIEIPHYEMRKNIKNN